MAAQEQEVLDLVNRWARVELAGDVAAYPGLLDKHFLGVGPVGFVLDKDQWAQRHQGSSKPSSGSGRRRGDGTPVALSGSWSSRCGRMTSG